MSKRSAASLLAVGMVLFGATEARAEDPIDRCLDSTQTANGSGGASEGFTPRERSLWKPDSGVADSRAGSVDLKTGSFSFTNEDIAAGVGEFPARLSLARTYQTAEDGPNSFRPPYAAGAPQLLPFGIGSTHNLDAGYEQGEASFGGKTYPMTYVHLGFRRMSFQGCAAGAVSSQMDGARLYPDTSISGSVFRVELGDGTKLYFGYPSLSPGTGHWYCKSEVFSTSPKCGKLLKWVSPNGDEAKFEYQEYYNNPSNETSVGSHAGPQVYVTATLGVESQCHATSVSPTDCRNTNHPAYYTINNGWAPQGSSAIYDWRLTKVSNSRGYYLQFSYRDSTVNEGGGNCSASYGGLSCTTQVNYDYTRHIVNSISAYGLNAAGVVTLLGTTQYTYASGSNPAGYARLASFQDAAGAVTTYQMGYNVTAAKNEYSITLPGASVPITKVLLTPAPKYYFFPTIRPGQPDYPLRLTYYFFRATQVSYPDGRMITYTPTLASRWVEEKYGTWEWSEYVSAMVVDQGSGSVARYDYNDASEDHFAPVKVTDPLNRISLATYDPNGSVITQSNPEGDMATYAYDARGNVLTRTITPKSGSPLSPLVESVTYVGGPTQTATACSNQKTCNRVLSKTDARGNQTDYQWDAGTGLILSEQAPAAPDGQRPTTTYNYTSLAGTGGTSISLPSTVTTAIGGTSSTTTGFVYSADVRRLLIGKAVTADGITLRTCYTYDVRGNVVSETSPRANLTVCP